MGFFLGISIGIFTNNIPGDFGAAISMTALAVVWAVGSGCFMIDISPRGTPCVAECVYNNCPSCCHSFDLDLEYNNKHPYRKMYAAAPTLVNVQGPPHSDAHGSGHGGAHGGASV